MLHKFMVDKHNYKTQCQFIQVRQILRKRTQNSRQYK